MAGVADRSDPLLAFRFQVRIGGDPLGGFSEVSGLGAEVEVLELAEGGENAFVHRLPGRTMHSNVTLRRGLATKALWNWFAGVVHGAVERQTVAVELLPPGDDVPAMRWVLDAAFPSRWTGPDFKADQSAVAVEAIELSHHGFLME